MTESKCDLFVNLARSSYKNPHPLFSSKDLQEFHSESMLRVYPPGQTTAVKELIKAGTPNSYWNVSFERLGPMNDFGKSNGIKSIGNSEYHVRNADAFSGSVNGTPLETFINEVAPTIDQIVKELIEARNAQLLKVSFNVRVSSNYYGIRVGSGYVKADKNGFHTHGDAFSGRISFLWAIHGKGSTFQNHPHMSEGEFAIFGDKVPHGSPESETERLLVVGTIEISPKVQPKP